MRSPEVRGDGRLPSADVGRVEKQARRCGAWVEVEVSGVQREVRDGLNRHHETSSPSGSIGESASGAVTAGL